MADLLIVASETSQPLSTDVPLPTDGQPEWRRCPCGPNARYAPGEEARHLCYFRDDGPFPFTVARWAEVEVGRCEGCVLVYPCRDGDPVTFDPFTCDDCGSAVEPETVGAVVELVEVTGPSHHAASCWKVTVDDPGAPKLSGFCHPDALPDCWHTPTGAVVPIDPIPCDQPWVAGDRSQATCSQCGQGWRAAACGPTHALLATEARHAATWVADADLTALVREAAHA